MIKHLIISFSQQFTSRIIIFKQTSILSVQHSKPVVAGKANESAKLLGIAMIPALLKTASRLSIVIALLNAGESAPRVAL